MNSQEFGNLRASRGRYRGEKRGKRRRQRRKITETRTHHWKKGDLVESKERCKGMVSNTSILSL
jgi:Ni/Co efflux regulator RcnB